MIVCIFPLFRFNPRSRGGSDLLCQHVRQAKYAFQSTLPRGERRANAHVLARYAAFQSTLPRGERLSFLVQSLARINRFNPRSRGGSDRPHFILQILSKLFQSTLPRGERLICCRRNLYPDIVSIHAPAGGATRMACCSRRW